MDSEDVKETKSRVWTDERGGPVKVDGKVTERIGVGCIYLLDALSLSSIPFLPFSGKES
jgi:hypothetical protein